MTFGEDPSHGSFHYDPSIPWKTLQALTGDELVHKIFFLIIQWLYPMSHDITSRNLFMFLLDAHQQPSHHRPDKVPVVAIPVSYPVYPVDEIVDDAYLLRLHTPRH